MNRLQLQVPATWTIELQNEAGKSYFHAMNLLGKLLKEYPDEAFYVHERLQQRIANHKQPAAFVLDDLEWLRELGHDELWMQELEDELLDAARTNLNHYLIRIEHPKYKPVKELEHEEDLTNIIQNLWILAQHEQAQLWLYQLSLLNPENGMVLIYKGRELSDAGQYQAAYNFLKRGYFLLARLLDKAENAETFEIAEYYRTASELDPSWVKPLHDLAYHLQNYQSEWTAEYYFSRLIQLCPENSHYYLMRGLINYSNNQALQDFTEAIRLSPFNPLAYYWRAHVRVKLNYLEKALEDLNQVRIQDPKGEVTQPLEELYLPIAKQFIEKLNFDSALEAATQACKVSQQPVFRKKSWLASLVLCAEIFAQQGHFEQALACLETMRPIAKQQEYENLHQQILQHQQEQA